MRSFVLSSGSSVTVAPFKMSHGNKLPDVSCSMSETRYLNHWDSKFSIDNSTCNTKWNQLQSCHKILKKWINSNDKTFPSVKGYNIFYIYTMQQCSFPRKIRFICFFLFCFVLCSIKIPPAKLQSIYTSTINSVSSLNFLADDELFWN